MKNCPWRQQKVCQFGLNSHSHLILVNEVEEDIMDCDEDTLVADFADDASIITVIEVTPERPGSQITTSELIGMSTILAVIFQLNVVHEPCQHHKNPSIKIFKPRRKLGRRIMKLLRSLNCIRNRDELE